MALLSQVSTSYPRVPRDSFLPSYGIFLLSVYRHFPSILLTTYDVLLHVYWLPHSDPGLSDFHMCKDILCPKVSVLSLYFHIYSIFYWDPFQLRKFYPMVFYLNISIDHICRIALSASVLWFEFWKANLRIPEKILICLFQMQLHICKCQRIHFFQKWICFFIHRRCISQHFFRCFIFPYLIIQHLII